MIFSRDNTHTSNPTQQKWQEGGRADFSTAPHPSLPAPLFPAKLSTHTERWAGSGGSEERMAGESVVRQRTAVICSLHANSLCQGSFWTRHALLRLPELVGCPKDARPSAATLSSWHAGPGGNWMLVVNTSFGKNEWFGNSPVAAAAAAV